MAVDEQAKLAYASVSELTKQLITLGTGVLTLEVTFAKAFFEKVIDSHWQLQASWGCLLLSVVAGIWVLMALTGSLAKVAELTPESVYASNIKFPALVQVISFSAGVIFTVLFGLKVSH